MHLQVTLVVGLFLLLVSPSIILNSGAVCQSVCNGIARPTPKRGQTQNQAIIRFANLIFNPATTAATLLSNLSTFTVDFTKNHTTNQNVFLSLNSYRTTLTNTYQVDLGSYMNNYRPITCKPCDPITIGFSRSIFSTTSTTTPLRSSSFDYLLSHQPAPLSLAIKKIPLMRN